MADCEWVVWFFGGLESILTKRECKHFNNTAMNKTPYHHLLLATLFFVSMIMPLTAQEASHNIALSELIRDLLEEEKLSWELTRRYDPYATIQHHRQAQPQQQQLTLASTGQVEVSSRSTERQKRGRWIIDPQENTLRLVFNAEGTASKTYRVEKYTEEVLILAQHGRHGWVKFHYQPL